MRIKIQKENIKRKEEKNKLQAEILIANNFSIPFISIISIENLTPSQKKRKEMEAKIKTPSMGSGRIRSNNEEFKAQLKLIIHM